MEAVYAYSLVVYDSPYNPMTDNSLAKAIDDALDGGCGWLLKQSNSKLEDALLERDSDVSEVEVRDSNCKVRTCDFLITLTPTDAMTDDELDWEQHYVLKIILDRLHDTKGIHNCFVAAIID